MRKTAQHAVVGGARGVILLSLFFSFNLTRADLAPREAITKAERRQREIMGELFTLKQTIRDANEKGARLTAKRLSEEARAHALARDVETLDENIRARQAALAARLRQLYKTPSEAPLASMFSNSKAGDWARTQKFLNLLAKDDQAHLAEFKSLRADRATKYASLKESVLRLKQIETHAVSVATSLAGVQKQKARLIAELERDKALHFGAWKSWRDAHPEDRPAFFEARGRLRPPVEGTLGRGFGPSVDHKSGFKLMHRGQFYKVEAGQDVRAVYDGVVALATEIPGFGATVILDHGDEYYSVYAFADKLRVSEGARLREGEAVASSGQGSPLFGPGVYFELRHFTDAIDPKDWIKDAFREELK